MYIQKGEGTCLCFMKDSSDHFPGLNHSWFLVLMPVELWTISRKIVIMAVTAQKTGGVIEESAARDMLFIMTLLVPVTCLG